MAYPLLSDRDQQISRAYAVLSKKGISYRATFLIDPQGRIRHYAVYPDEVGRSPAEIIRVLKGLQHYESTNEQEPAWWRPGMNGIVAEIGLAGRI